MTHETEREKGWLETNLEDPEFRLLYAREEFIEDFLEQIEQCMLVRGVSRTQLAEKLGCTSANVTRIMRRTANLTAATIADLACALDLRAKLRLEPAAEWTVGRYVNHVAGAGCAKAPFEFPERAARGRWPALRVRSQHHGMTIQGKASVWRAEHVLAH